ncbi:MAG: stage II sporulation protein M [Pirellulales bacterium]|nr:stage II sporulation protein M [Pirellulales bacterium]
MDRRNKRRIPPESINRFAALYRSACADLALADAYHLPPNTVAYLHQLVARAHNQLYRSRGIDFGAGMKEIFVTTPQRLFNDNSLRLAFFLFFGLFFLSYYLAYYLPDFANSVINFDGTTTQTDALREMYAQGFKESRSWTENSSMAGFYISHNASIGIVCFASGLLFLGVGGLPALTFNAIFLGAVFGYMDTTPQSQNFSEFVTAHGPFELTAIVLSAGAGMRLGFSLLNTQGLSRMASLRKCGRETTPMIAAAVMLFIGAAFIEGFISPSAAPYAFKAIVGAASSSLLLFYFVFLGWPWKESLGENEVTPHPAGSWEYAVTKD